MSYSVIIPALNEEKNIGKCIQEVKKQAVSAEIIVVDGNSNDKTVEISEELDVKVIIEEKPTIAAGRQTGLKNASGDIVCYVDADTIPYSGWFEKITKPFSDPGVVAVGGMPRPIDGSKLECFGMKLVFGLISSVLFKFQIPLVTGQNMAVRKKEALDVGGFDTDIIHGEDTGIFLKLRDVGRIDHSNSYVLVSMRRVRRWGLLKYLSFNIRNYYSLLRYNTPIKDGYEPIRKN